MDVWASAWREVASPLSPARALRDRGPEFGDVAARLGRGEVKDGKKQHTAAVRTIEFFPVSYIT